MAKISDSLNRIMGDGDLQAMLKLIKDKLLRPTGPARPVEKPPKDEANKLLEEILTTNEDLLKEIEDSFEEIKKSLSKTSRTTGPIVKSVGAVPKSASEPMKEASSGILKSFYKQQSLMAKGIALLAKHGTKKGSIYTHDTSVETAVIEGFKAQGAGPSDPTAATSSTVNVDGSGISKAGENMAEVFTSGFKPVLLGNIATILAGFSSAMLAGYSVWQTAFSGVVKDELNFMMNMRQIAFQTEGITGATRELQRTYQQIGDVVSQTGFNLSEFQEQYLKNLKKGVKSQKETIAVTKTGMNLSTMIGSNVDETNETFNSWHMSLLLSNDQLSQMSRSIQMTAKDTGVTGDNLLNAVKSSEKFLKNMRDAGTFSARTAGTIISMQAAAQKMGIEETAAPILSSLSSTVELMSNANDQTKNLLFSIGSFSGRQTDLFSGTLLDTRAGIKDFASGMEDTFKRLNMGKGFDQLPTDPMELAALNLRLHEAFGMTTVELKKMFDIANVEGKSFADRMGEINNKLKEQNLTAQERIHLEEQGRQLQIKTGLDFLDPLMKASQNATSIGEAMQNVSKEFKPGQFGEITADLKNAGVDVSSSASMINDTLMMTAKKLTESGGTDFSADIQKAMASGNVGQMRSVIEALQTEQQKLGVDKAKGVDPITDLSHAVNELNEGIRQVFGTSIIRFVDALGKGGLIVLHLGAMAASLAYLVSLFGGMNVLLSSVGDTLGKVFASSRIASAAGGAATGAGSVIGGLGATIANLGTDVAFAAGRIGKFVASKILTKPFFILTGIIGAVTGSFKAGAEAATLFNTTTDKVTMSQKMAAEGAGLLTGILDFLTLGLIGPLGPTGSLTKALAGMLAAFAPLNLALQFFVGIGKIAWGIIKGIGMAFMNTFVGLWNGIKNIFGGIVEGIRIAIDPFIQIWNTFTGIISSIFSPIDSLKGSLEGTWSLVDMFSNSIGALGSVLGGILSFIGTIIGTAFKVLGFAISLVLKPIQFFAQIMMNLLAPGLRLIVSVLTFVFDGVYKFVSGLFKVITGILTFDFGMIWGGLKEALFDSFLAKVISPFTSVLGTIWNMISGPLNAIWEGMVGPIMEGFNYLKESFVVAKNMIIQPFVDIWNSLKAAVQPLFDAVYNAFMPIMDIFSDIGALFGGVNGEAKTFTSAFKFIGKILGSFIGNMLKGVGLLVKGFGFVANILINVLLTPLKMVIQGLSTVLTPIVALIGYLGNKLKEFFGGIYNVIAGVINLDLGQIWDGLVNVFTTLPSMIGNAIMSAFSTIPFIGKYFKTNTPVEPPKPIVKPQEANIVPQQRMISPEFKPSTDFYPSYISQEERIDRFNERINGQQMSPKPFIDPHVQLQREQLSNSDSRDIVDVSKLTEISGNSADQASEQRKTNELLEQLIGLLAKTDNSSGKTSGGSASTRGNRKPHNSPDNGTWQFGKLINNPSANVINTGI